MCASSIYSGVNGSMEAEMSAEHIPTVESRRVVESSSGIGLRHEIIGILIGIDDKTLRLHYRQELDMGKARAHSKITQTLFDKATIDKDTTSLIWWTKTQLNWAETVKQVVTGENGAPLLTAIQVQFVEPTGTGRES